jgi:FtsH-binding integral membrane protein
MLIPFAGCMITVCSNNPVFSFIGYNMIVAPFGFLLGPAVNQYSPNVVKDAAMGTLMVTVCMGALGVILPDLFRNMGGALFSALLCLVIVRIVQIFVPRFDFGWIDYAAALLFSLYIGFDMCRASEIPKTPDNAVDVAAQLYLDILNLFLIILKIMGKRK